MPTRSIRPTLPAPSPGDYAALYDLWRCIDSHSAADWEAALRCLQQWIAQTIDADNAIWIGAIRVLKGPEAEDDAFLGWRLRGRVPLYDDPEAYRKQLSAYYHREHYGKITPTYYERSHAAKEKAHIGLTSRASMAGAGSFRVHRLRDGWIDFAEFRRSLHYKLYYEESGIRDRIWIGFPVTEDRESFFLIDRIQQPGAARRAVFSLRQARLVGDALRGLPLLHRRVLLGSGLLTADKPLSPMERDILRGLLSDRTEKQIASATGQKPATLHKYVTALYAHFGVRSRAALMALWLDGSVLLGSVVTRDHPSASL